MDIFEISVIIILLSGAAFGVYFWGDYTDYKESIKQSYFSTEHKKICNDKNMRYETSIEGYAVCYIESPMNIDIIKSERYINPVLDKIAH